jgi:Methyltransferase domain
MARIFGLKTGLDIGGGDGLLCRLLRDYGLNCYATDKYAQAKYSTGFTKPPYENPDLLTAFEVFEHFSEPAREYAELFAWKPKLILASTGIYDSQPSDRWYFAPGHGQHVFLHSQKAFEWLAKKYDYRLLLSGGYILFVQPERWGTRRAFRARLGLKGKMVALARAQLAFKSYAGAQRDHEALRDQLRAAAKPMAE